MVKFERILWAILAILLIVYGTITTTANTAARAEIAYYAGVATAQEYEILRLWRALGLRFEQAPENEMREYDI